MAGFDPQPNSTIGIFRCLLKKERLRTEAGHRTEVVVGVVRPVRVELELAVVPVEVGRVREVTIGVRSIVFVHPWHRSLKTVLVGSKAYSCS